MKAQNLRIGNYFNPINRQGPVHMPIESIIKKVFTIGPFKVTSCDYQKNFCNVAKMDEFDIFDISPIPLTEEWLIKFGFTCTANYCFMRDINIDLNDCSCWLHQDFNDFHIRDIKYVHQLQNLYFALTNEELTIK